MRDYVIRYPGAQNLYNVKYLIWCRRKYRIIISPKDNKEHRIVCQMGRAYAGRASFVRSRRESGVIIG